MAVLLQVLLAVDPVERRRERRQERAGRELQIHHEGGVVGRLDRLDHAEERLADTRHAFGREDEPVVGGLDVLGRHRRPVVERHPFLDLERIRLAAVGRLRHVTDAEVADEIRGLGIFRIDPNQQAVERGVGVHDGVGGFPVSVFRRRLAGHDEFEGSTLLDVLRGHGLGAETNADRAAEQQRGDGPGSGAPYVAFHRWFLPHGLVTVPLHFIVCRRSVGDMFEIARHDTSEHATQWPGRSSRSAGRAVLHPSTANVQRG